MTQAQAETDRKVIRSVALRSAGGFELVARQHVGATTNHLSDDQVWRVIDLLDSSELKSLVKILEDGEAFRVGDVVQLADAIGRFTIDRLLDSHKSLGMTAVATLNATQEDPAEPDYAISLRGARLVQFDNSIDASLVDKYKLLKARKESR